MLIVNWIFPVTGANFFSGYFTSVVSTRLIENNYGFGIGLWTGNFAKQSG